MNKQFTPGPWKVEGKIITHDYYREGVALVYERNKDHEANARLIAAAPEMFELLEEIAQCGVIRIEEINNLLTKITTP